MTDERADGTRTAASRDAVGRLGRIADAPFFQRALHGGMLLAAAVVAVLGVVARQEGVARFRTIWAEDGAVFAQCGFDGSLLRCLATPYDAWVHVVPRLLAAMATAFDPTLLSYVLTALAAIVSALAAVLVARAVVDTTGARATALLAGASLTLVYPAAGEVGGNITNLHWILLAAAVTVTASTWMGHRFGRADALLVSLTVASSPFGLLIVAIAAIGAILRRPRMVGVTALTGVIALVQLGVAVANPRITLPAVPSAGTSPIGLYVDTVVQAGIFGPSGWVPDSLVTIGLIATIFVLAALAWRQLIPPIDAGAMTRVGSRLVDAGAILAMLAAGVAVFAASWLLNRHVAGRHVYVASELTVLALLTGLGRVLAAHPGVTIANRRMTIVKHGIGILAVVTIAIGFATSFRVRNAAGNGPDFPREIASERVRCASGAGVLPLTISPLPTPGIETIWQIAIPCDRLAR